MWQFNVLIFIFYSSLFLSRTSHEIDRCKNIPHDEHYAYFLVMDKCDKLLLQYIKDGGNIDVITSEGDSLLNIAISMDYISTVDLLLKNHAKVILNEKNASYGNAFEQALIHGNIESIQLFERLRPDIVKKTSHSDNVIYLAAFSNKTEVIDYLLKKKYFIINRNDELPLHASQTFQMFKYLINLGYDPMEIDKYGNTLIHIMSSSGNIQLLQYLTKTYNFDINKKNNNGYTALMAGVSANKISSVKFLIKENADPKIKNNNGQTAYDLSKKYGYTDIAQFLDDAIKN